MCIVFSYGMTNFPSVTASAYPFGVTATVTSRSPTTFLQYCIQIYHVWEAYLRKIPVERRKMFRAEWRGKFSLKTGIFRKYPSQT